MEKNDGKFGHPRTSVLSSPPPLLSSIVPIVDPMKSVLI